MASPAEGEVLVGVIELPGVGFKGASTLPGCPANSFLACSFSSSVFKSRLLLGVLIMGSITLELLSEESVAGTAGCAGASVASAGIPATGLGCSESGESDGTTTFVAAEVLSATGVEVTWGFGTEVFSVGASTTGIEVVMVG